MAETIELQLTKARTNRAAIRRRLTTMANAVDTILEADGPDVQSITSKMTTVESSRSRLNDLDMQISALLLDSGANEDQIEEEYARADEYQDRLNLLKVKVDSLLKAQSEEVDTVYFTQKPIGEKEGSKLFKIPQLDIKKFDGNVKNWIGFWGQFKKIDQSTKYDDDEKFQCLRLYTEEGSKARKLVESFPPSGENYAKALTYLKDRCAKDELIIEAYIRDILDLVIQQVTASSRLSLDELFDRLETQLRALETLGVTREKYAAMLYPLVESSLPREVLRAWGRYRMSQKQDASAIGARVIPLDELMAFLRAEVETEERIEIAYSSFALDRKTDHGFSESVPTSSSLVSVEKTKTKGRFCIFCEKETGHSSQDCVRAHSMTLAERKERVVQHKACFSCLRKDGHRAEKCKAVVKCIICSRKHFPIICEKKGDGGEALSNQNHTGSRKLILLQTLIAKVIGPQRAKEVRILLDSGSQRSYILSELANDLRLKTVGEERLSHGLFGGVNTARVNHKIFLVKMTDLDEEYSIELELLGQEKICNTIPRISQAKGKQILDTQNIKISDVGPNTPEIGVLLGADVIGRIITGRVKKMEDGIVGQQTFLGWTISGGDRSQDFVHSNICLTNFSVSELWDLESLGVKEIPRNSVTMNDTAMNFKSSIRREANGRYLVSLPWLPGRPPLGSNLDRAKERLFSTTRRLAKLGKFHDYDQVFQGWLAEGIIETAKDMGDERGKHYLPHHAVIKEASATTKIRPVFDASALDRKAVSLNSCLDKGPNLVAQIPTLMTKFRFRKLGVTADIRAAFLQIGLAEQDRDYLRFLWWEDKTQRQIRVFRHCRVVFGVASSPFLLGATIAHHLDNAPEQLRETAARLKPSFYVDNCVESFDTKQELDQFMAESTQLMSMGQFDLRGWVYTDQNLEVPMTMPILGLVWNIKHDSLGCNMSALGNVPDKITKREILSVVQRVFDPIGFTSPTTLLPKLMLQETWRLKLTWDQTVPQDIARRYQKWTEELAWVAQCSIPRWVHGSRHSQNNSIHVFCDASKLAYSAAIFLRSESEEGVTVQLLFAKARLAPIEEMTIPRLELLGALMATRMTKAALEDTPCDKSRRFFWTDSMTVLTWIHFEEPWNTFVGNRIREIRTNSRVCDWRYVPGKLNPADLPSRGCNGKALLESQWWNGPEWLHQGMEEWPHSVVEFDERAGHEKKKTVNTLVICNEANLPLEKLSHSCEKYFKILRIRAWMNRFVDACKKRANTGDTNELTKLPVIKNREGKIRIGRVGGVERQGPGEKKIGFIPNLESFETENAELSLIKLVQKQELNFGRKSKVGRLNTFVDGDGLVRVKTKLLLGKDALDFKQPIILPPTHPLVLKLIWEQHRAAKHAGVLTLMTILRDKFWLLKSRKTIRSIVNKCVVCRRYGGKSAVTVPAPLPQDRHELGKAFAVSGVDLAGPLILKGGSKAWVVLFTCAVYRGVHLELVLGLSTESFLMALRRFINRRGRVHTIYSDNGTNFVGAYNLLNQIDWVEVQDSTATAKISWKFSPPAAPWWGGFWERMVRTTKELIRKTLGTASVTYEEMTTVLCDVEAIINSRPLTYVSVDPEDLEPLTPAMFLQDIPTADVPDIDRADRDSLVTHARQLQRVREGLRQRFHKEYLAQLVQDRSSWKVDNIKPGDIVLVEGDTKKRVKWPLARVLEVKEGKDGAVRVATVKTSAGVLMRPIQKLYPLEISSAEAHEITKGHRKKQDKRPKPTKLSPNPGLPGSSGQGAPTQTRLGRLVQPPRRFQGVP